MQKNIEERIAYLELCANLYETGGNSPLTDAEYDKEYELCQELMPDHPFFSKVGGINEGYIYGKEVEHKYKMGSLNKSPNPTEFTEWFNKTFPFGANLIGILEPKVDGSAFCLKYDNGKLFQAVTRGDGEKGFDFTPNAKYVKGVKETINTKEYVEIKGEVYKNRQDFYEKWAGEYENPRNFATGSLQNKDPLITKQRDLNFVAYDVRGISFPTEISKLDFLVKNGFETLSNYIQQIDFYHRMDIENIVDLYMNKFNRETLPFDIDGVVFKLNNIPIAEEMGYTDDGKRPKASRAIKFPTDQKTTILEDIEWSIGRTGTITPVGLLKPVRLAGTTVKRVSLHNIKELNRLGIDNLNCEVLVEKAGDIIPKVVKKIVNGVKELIFPKKCPCCHKLLEWNDTGVNLICTNINCLAQLDNNINFWVKTIGVKGIGIKIISEFTNNLKNSYDEPMVKCISDMYYLRHYCGELREIFGSKAADNILDAMDSVKTIDLATFIRALGIGNIGTMAKDIVQIAPTIEDIDRLTIADIIKIDGFAEIKAKSFINGWKNKRDEINKILQHITIKSQSNDGKLSGKSFCFTGSFSNPTRKEMEKTVEQEGGRLSSVGKSLTALVWDGEIQGNKIEKAKKLGLSIISQKDFLAFLQ